MDGGALGVEGRPDIDDAIYELLGSAREVIFLTNGVRLEACLEMLREVFFAASHPAGCFDPLRGNVMVGILLIVIPWIVAENGVHFEQAEQKDQAGPQLDSTDVVHTMVAISQIEYVF